MTCLRCNKPLRADETARCRLCRDVPVQSSATTSVSALPLTGHVAGFDIECGERPQEPDFEFD